MSDDLDVREFTNEIDIISEKFKKLEYLPVLFMRYDSWC